MENSVANDDLKVAAKNFFDAAGRSARKIAKKIMPASRWRFIMTFTGYHLNDLGIRIMAWGRQIVQYMNRHITDKESDRFVSDLPGLHKRINSILKRQRKEYPHYSYFSGYPYQSLGILGVYGERASEERFDSYNLASIVKSSDRVLDIGCNCGFMSILTTYRTGAYCHGIDINPYMTEIGTECAKFLNIGDRIRLEGKKFQDVTNDEKYDVIFSFATHWTDDGNYRVALEDHLKRIHDLLQPNGTLVFESHCSDVGDQKFYDVMTQMKSHFSWDAPKPTDNGLRELYIMKKVG